MVPASLRIEQWTLPAPDIIHWNGGELRVEVLSTLQKVKYYTLNVIRLIGEFIALPFIAIYSGMKGFCNRSAVKQQDLLPSAIREEIDYASVLSDEAKVGFAGSVFQDTGAGTRYSAAPELASPSAGTCNWDDFLTPEQIEGVKEADHFKQFFINILGNPDPFIAILKEMGSTAYRFSLEWSVIEKSPEAKNSKAISLYQNFIDKLLENGIEPRVTLHHFVHPQWFEKRGAFNSQDNIGLYVQHCLEMMRLFPQVEHWYTFNEVGAFGLETMLGDFPSQIKDNAAAAGRLMRNMLIAHCQIFKRAKEEFPNKKIGITHQWIKFNPVGGNALEKVVCYILSKITHYAVYHFFKTGQFVFDIPGKANIRFSIPDKEFQDNHGFLDSIGLQFYGPAQLKLGWNHGERYPGSKIKNFCWKNMGFTFGATCRKNESVMSFGPTVKPEALETCLEEAAALGVTIDITEIGCDAKIQRWGEDRFTLDETTQAQTIAKYAPILQRFKEQIGAFFVWSVYASEGMDTPGQLEWNRGAGTKLPVVIIEKDKDRLIVGSKSTEASRFLQKWWCNRAAMQLHKKAV